MNKAYEATANVKGFTLFDNEKHLIRTWNARVMNDVALVKLELVIPKDDNHNDRHFDLWFTAEEFIREMNAIGARRYDSIHADVVVLSTGENVEREGKPTYNVVTVDAHDFGLSCVANTEVGEARNRAFSDFIKPVPVNTPAKREFARGSEDDE